MNRERAKRDTDAPTRTLRTGTTGTLRAIRDFAQAHRAFRDFKPARRERALAKVIAITEVQRAAADNPAIREEQEALLRILQALRGSKSAD